VAVDKIVLRFGFVAMMGDVPYLGQTVVATNTRRDGVFDATAGIIDKDQVNQLILYGLIKLGYLANDSAQFSPVYIPV
jgi:hypothetical protein